MNRYELSKQYRDQGYNCSQAVIAAFADCIPMDVETALNISSGFGGGAGAKELCGAISGGIMVLGLVHPVDPSDPVGSKNRAVKRSKELEAAFMAHFGYLRCGDLMQNPVEVDDSFAIAQSLGMTKHCDLMVVVVVELVAQMLVAEGIL